MAIQKRKDDNIQRYRPLWTHSVRYTADKLTVCLSSHHWNSVKQNGDYWTLRELPFGQKEAEAEFAGICANAVIAHMGLLFLCSC